MRDHGIGSWTARRARKTPHRTAVIHGERRYDYGWLHAAGGRLAHRLRGIGVGRGDRVAFLGPNHPAFLLALFATARLGAVFVPLNTRLSGPELAHCVADSGAMLLLHTAGLAERAAETAAPAALEVGVDQPGPDAELDEEVGLDDLAMIMYTSGTTGAAKGAVLTHGNLTWNAVNTVIDGDIGDREVTLLSAPMFHTAALNMTCLPTLLRGGTLVLAESFDAAGTLDLVERHRITTMFGVPAMYQRIAAEPRFATADLSSVRRLLCGGASVPEALIRTYAERGVGFVQGYGMTEASPGICLLDPEHALAKTGSAGLPHFFNDVRVIDPAGEDAERGELLVEGPTVMRGYWRAPEASAEALLPGGWLRTGDVAVRDADGYVTLVDRIKDVIISGGENVYPAEVEKALYEHPDVADCAVIGVPDERWGEVGRAVVVLRPGATADEAALLASLDGRLARYKIPRSVVFAAELPRSGAGKLLKRPIRETYGAP